MALGWGEGGEQNAPLGRAVIGGLVFATVATLLFCANGVSADSRPKARARGRLISGRLQCLLFPNSSIRSAKFASRETLRARRAPDCLERRCLGYRQPGVRARDAGSGYR